MDDGQIRIITDDESQTLFKQLGLRLAPAVAALPEVGAEGISIVSPENVDALEADVVLMSFVGDDSRALLESNPVFQQLDAVRNGNYIALERPVSQALGFPSALSFPYGLDRAVAKIARVLA